MQKLSCLVIVLFSLFSLANAARQMERLDRGLIAVKTNDGVFLSWRMFGTDAESIAFNLYRDGKKVNAQPITNSTNFVDAAGALTSRYEVRAVEGGVEKEADKSVNVWESQKWTIPLDRPAGGSNASGSYTYSPNDIAVGDLDGDGEYELVLKWDPSNSKDNSQKGYTGNVIVDAYKLDGTKLWRIDLGKNIRAGAHYTQILVGDYDLDGFAEVAMKTAPGTKDGSGKYLSKGPAANDDDGADYRNSSGYVLSGNEYLTVFNGKTGVEMATVLYNPARGTVKSWGDSYGNRVDRFLATNAYLDGVKPSMVFQRGYYTRMAITAYDWDGTTLSQRWYYNAATSGQECYGQGNHNISAGDVDGDGFDEIIEGSCAVDHDGKFMYRTGLGHGDAIHLGDLDPDNEGLEVWQVHEDKPYGYEVHDARTGKLLWRETSSGDNGRGVAADVDSTSRGYEMWSAANWNTYSAKGKILASSRPAYNFRVYWDGDLLDELLDGVTISKWNSSTSKSETLMKLDGSSCNSTKATPNLSADILGDWREEIITHDDSHLFLYTTTILTDHRVYTLMHDPIYRLGISWQNTAYNQPPHLGFWLGSGSIPKPDIELVGEILPPSIAKNGAGSSRQIIVLGDSIVPFAYAYSHCSGAEAAGFPKGIVTQLEGGKIHISGTPQEVGTFPFTVKTLGGEGEAATLSGVLTVLPQLEWVKSGKILSYVNAAFPEEGAGEYEETNAGWIDSGYYNFTNSKESFGVWKIFSPEEKEAVLTIRFANGGTVERPMLLTWNDSVMGKVAFPATGWTAYDSVAISVPIRQGANTMRLASMTEDGGPNVDEFGFDVAGIRLWNAADSSLIPESFNRIADKMIPALLSVSRNGIAYTLSDAQEASLSVFDIHGKIRFVQKVQGCGMISDKWNALPAGRYVVTLRKNGVLISKMAVKR